jgi:ubiquinone/menaquinone biosynthesis C-methylase UbiE
MKDKNRVCPVEKADSLDTRWRRFFQNPRKILDPFIKEGMTVMDFGCGPGYFTIDMATMVGNAGHVIAADLQEGMLDKLRNKIQGKEIEKRITLQKCEENKIGLKEKVDFVLAFYVVHEIPDQETFFRELGSILQPGAEVLIVEPPFHVSRSGFSEMIGKAEKSGLNLKEGPKGIFSKTVILVRG